MEFPMYQMHNTMTLLAQSVHTNMKLKMETPPAMSLNNSTHGSPKARPTPTFFMQRATFSTKKEKETPKLLEVHPPRPPMKSCPPISRIKPRKALNGAREITNSTDKNKNHDISDIIMNKHYDLSKMNLYFEQCFIIEGNLGCGSFGKVYKVKSREDGKHYAIKKSHEKFKGSSDRVRKLQEVLKHEELPPHANCVRFHRAWEEKDRLYIQIELCQMSLSKYAETHHEIPEDIIWQYLVDLLQAIKHLHDRNLIHMDIKPDNIFISHDGVCKLGDFGLVVDLNKLDSTKEAQEGDPKYLAPEVLKGRFTLAADVFSLGMTILELATDLDVPRGGDAWHELRTGKLPIDIKHNLSNELVNIIVRMIDPNYLTRPTAAELLELDIIKDYLSTRKYKQKIFKSFFYVYNIVLGVLLTIWYFILYPFKKLSLLNIHSLNNDCTNSSNNSALHHTSTPNRDIKNNSLHGSLMNMDDEDHEMANVQINDSFSTYNNSYMHPLNDSSSSSASFSDGSDISTSNRIQLNTRKLHSEPVNMIKANMLKNRSTPFNTPPCKKSYLSNKNSPTSVFAPARQKLIFDDNDMDVDINENTENKKQTIINEPPILSLKLIV